MLVTETYTLDEAHEELTDRIDTLEETLDDLEQGTDEYKVIKSRRDRVSYLERGIRWQRDEEEWGGDTEIELGSMTAGEEAMMHRDVPDSAGTEERRLWFVAASTVDAPYAGDDLEATFADLASCHPAFVEWLEAKLNTLGIPGSGSGNASPTSSPENGTTEETSSTSSEETETSETSTAKQNSTTTSSSASPTE